MTANASDTTAPLADARALGLAHYAARGVLEHVLARHGLTFEQQITLRAAVTAHDPLTPDDLVAQVRASLKTDPAGIRTTVDELVTRELLTADGTHLRPTHAGRDLMAAVGAEIAPVSARIWGGIPTEDLAAAGRVLTLVTRRAEAELAALSA
ncbi:MarR family transcriptional regulator [Streptomyces sp. 15-116A]|uniref:MarR family winged helix-turn-helix transcriptional regulator n=1 Tax=Streptomyces sp. 15-116A TaxID=2259035 RepID=UPI0021B19500|nr:MarR family transcriptional regulator [Streptomyces sp. 15-116A]MCT7355177.1 MarR family transcriptional regulator [Streptomyces sp. 15-116A]